MVPWDEDYGLCPFSEVSHDGVEEVHADGAPDMEEISQENDACPPSLRFPMDVL